MLYSCFFRTIFSIEASSRRVISSNKPLQRKGEGCRLKKIYSILVVFAILTSLLFSSICVQGVQAQTSSIWSTQTVQPVNISGGFAQVVALDSNGYPQIMYCEGSSHTLFYARWTGSAWNIESVASNAGTAISFVLDSNDKPYVVFNTVSYVSLKYAKLEGTNWNIQTLDSASGVNSIALDSSGNPCVAYVDSNTGTLKYARWSGSAWSISTVDASGNVFVGLNSFEVCGHSLYCLFLFVSTWTRSYVTKIRNP